MRYRKTEIWKSVDWFTILLYTLMVIAGWFSICGASYAFDDVSFFDPSGRPGMQLIWIATSVAIIFVILMLESDFFEIFAYLIYAAVLALLIVTIFVAPNINFENPDEYSEKLNLATETIEREVNVVLSNSFGFGGTNSALVIKKM